MTEMVAVETSIDMDNFVWIFYDCLSIRYHIMHMSVHGICLNFLKVLILESEWYYSIIVCDTHGFVTAFI